MSSSSANPSAARAALENEQLTALWKSYHESTQEEQKERLVTFLSYLVKSEVIRTSFDNETTVAQVLYQWFQEQIQDRVGEGVAEKMAVFDYLVSREGFLLLLAISKLSKRGVMADPAGLCDHCVQATAAVLDLPTSVLSREQTQLDKELVELAVFRFEPMETDWPVLRAMPTRFLQLFAPFASPVDPSSHHPGNNPQLLMDETPLGFICFYLLDIVGNLHTEDFALTELYSSKRLDVLLLLLSRSPQDTDDGLVTVHRKLTRVLSKIISQALRSGPKWVPVLLSSPLLPTLLESSANSHVSSNLVLQEITQILVLLLTESTRYSYELLENFTGLEGYVILAKNLKEIAKTGSIEQQILLLKTICTLLFLHDPRPGQTPDVIKRSLELQRDEHHFLPSSERGLHFTIQLFKTLQTVLTGGTKSYDLKTQLFNVVLEILLIGAVKQRELADSGLLPLLLTQAWFDQQSLFHRFQVLKIAKQIAMTAVLTSSEVSAFSKLYSSTESVSSAIIVSTHLTDLIRMKAITPQILTEAGFGACIFRLLEVPTPGSGLHELVTNDIVECHQIFTNSISEAQAKPKDANLAKAKSDEYTFRTLSTLLAFAHQFFWNNPAGVEPFLSAYSDLKTLFALIRERSVSRPALLVLSALAVGDKTGNPSGLLKDAMTLLNHSELQTTLAKPTSDKKRLDHLDLYVDTLGTLRYILHSNPTLKNVLRNGGGFTWLLANIKIALSAWVPTEIEAPASPEVPHSASPPLSPTSSSPSTQPPSLPSHQLFIVLTELLATLGDSLKGNQASKDGFAWGWFSLNDMLAASTLLYETPSFVVGLADSLLSVCTIHGWPAACINHRKPVSGSWSPGVDFASPPASQLPAIPPPITQTLASSRQNISECAGCKEALQIELPQAFKLLIDLLGRYTELTTGVSSASLDELDQPINEESIRNKRLSMWPQSIRDDTETAYIVILKSCKLLLDEHPANARVLSSVGTCLHILTGLKALLLLEKVTPSSTSRQPLLLQLVEKIASYSISLAEFHKFIELLRVPTCPINFLQTLCTISSRTISNNFAPQAFMTIPKAKDVLIRSPTTQRTFGSHKWPPRAGYTLTFWFSYDKLPDESGVNMQLLHPSAEPTIMPIGDLVRLVSMEATLDRKQSAIEVLLTTTGHLHLRSSADLDGIVLEGYTFKPGSWYHVTISQSRGAPLNNRSNASTSSITMWVNGIRNTNGQWTIPDMLMTSNFAMTFGSSSRPFAPNGATATSPITTASVPTCGTAWQLGNAIIFNTPLQTDSEVLCLYMLGPNYTGGFSGINLKDFLVHDIISSYNLSRLSAEDTHLLLSPERINLHPLHEHIFCFWSSAEQTYACRPEGGQKPSLKSRSGDLEGFAAELVGDVSLATRLSVSDVIQYAGGISTMLYYFATTQHPEQQKLALRIVIALISWHAPNAKDLRDNHGYLLIARVIRKLEWIIDEELLAIVFSLVGISRSEKRNSYSEGSVRNIEAFHALLLDWKVWKYAPNKIKLLLFKSIADLVSTSENASFNAWFLRQAGARTALLLILEDPLFPYQLANHIITTIAYLMNDPWTPGDMKAVLRFMIATHPEAAASSNVAPPSPRYGLQTSASVSTDCPLGVAHKLNVFNGIQAHSLPVRFETAEELNDGFSWVDDTYEEDEGSIPHVPLPSRSPSRTRSMALSARNIPGDEPFIVDPDVPPTRDLIFNLVLDMLQKASLTNLVLFFTEICPKEVLLTLLQTPVLSSRVILLKILEVYIKTPALGQTFNRIENVLGELRTTNGYRLLGEILRKCEPHDDILTVLFSILFGKPVSYHMLRTTGVARDEKDPSNVEHPEVVSTLLILLTSCTAERAKIHTVIQIIFDIALHSEQTKAAFVQAGLIDYLCHLFVFELEHRIGRLSLTFHRPSNSDVDSDGNILNKSSNVISSAETMPVKLKSGLAPTASPSAPSPVAQSPRTAESSDATDYSIEQDVLRFLRSIIIASVEEGDGTLANLQQVLGIIRTLPLPLQYVSVLQKQVAYETLEVLNGLDFSSPQIYVRMQKVATFVINLTINLDRNSIASTEKAYQLSRYSNMFLSAKPSATRLSSASLGSPLATSSEIPVTITSSGSASPFGTSSLSSSSSSLRQNKPTRRVSFWEILDSFDANTASGDSTPKMSTSPSGRSLSVSSSAAILSPSKSATMPGTPSSSTNVISIDTPKSLSSIPGKRAYVSSPPASSESDSVSSTPPTSPTIPQTKRPINITHTDEDEGANNGATSPRAMTEEAGNSGSETDTGAPSTTAASASALSQHDVSALVDLTTEEFSLVTRRAWSGGDFLKDDKQLVELIFQVFERELAHKKATTSAFKKLGQTIRHKMVGVNSLDDIATNVAWHVERLIFHVLKDRPISFPRLVEFVLMKVATIHIPGSFLSETEFLSRFMKYSSKLLGGANSTWLSSAKQTMTSSPELAAATLSCWKNLLTNTKPSVAAKIITSATVGLIKEADGSNAIPVDKIAWAESLADRISRVEGVDHLLRREWTKLFKFYMEEYANTFSLANRAIRDATRKLSDTYLKKVETLLKPSLRLVERQMTEEKYIRQGWKEILSTVTHERAAWPIQRSLLRWELDPTEGPLRTRLRLMPVYAHRHPIIGGEGYAREKYSHDPKDVYLTTDLDAKKVELLKALENQLNENELGPNASVDDESPVPAREHVIKYFPCSRITPFHKRDGELVIGAMNVYFIDSHQFKDEEEAQRKYTSVKKHSTWPYDEIKEIHKRRHLLINNALEIFLITGRTYLLGFRTTKDRDTVYDLLVLDRSKLPNFMSYESEVFISGKWTKMSITDKWRKGLITNFEYLMHLNTLAGRTYNDLTQYPVFPYILKDYASSILSFDQTSCYRVFDLPMGAQDPQRLVKFIEKYQALLDLGEEKPYFYGSHYSNVGTVLHFLIRLEPFSQYFIEFQSGRFDVPDRVFHSVGQSWDLSSSQSQSDVKELIPEFFYLPEFLLNSNRFLFGSKQDGTRVDSVLLPSWAHGSARTFIFRHMEALESEYVSFHLHEWIDLIFGFRQLGVEAVRAQNQFHPYTYEGAVDISKITDPIERDATITQINSYGQTPTQLFKEKHPKRSEHYARSSNPDGIHVCPDRLQLFPALSWMGVRKLHFHNGTPVALGPRQELLWPSGTQYLQWGNWDGSLRAINLKTKQVDFEAQLFTSFRDRITCVDVSKDGRVIVAGSESGLVRVWQKTTQTHINKTRQAGSLSATISVGAALPPERVSHTSTFPVTPVTHRPGIGLSIAHNSIPTNSPYNSIGSQGTPSVATFNQASNSSSALPEYSPSAILSGHSVDVSCVKANSQQSIIVSGAKDGSVIVWDLNRLKFVRTLLPSQPSSNPVTITHIEVMMYTSEIVVVEDHLVKGTSSIVLLSVNGERIASRACSDKIGALAVTSEKPGLARNIIITGHNTGDIRFWSAFDLSPVRLLDRTQQVPVTALCVSDDFGCLFAGHAQTGVVTCHAVKPARFIS